MKRHWLQKLQLLLRNGFKKRGRNWIFGTPCGWVGVKISSSILLCILGELAGAVSFDIFDMWHATRDMWHVPCYMWHVTCDMWHLTPDTWHLTPIIFWNRFFKILKCFCIDATIRTCWEIQCLPYAGFFVNVVFVYLSLNNSVLHLMFLFVTENIP